MKKLNIVFLLTIILILWPISTLAQNIIEDNPEIDTSIVLFTLFDANQQEIYKQDDFFEIFYFSDEDYILLPANLIAPYLEVDLNFNRELSLLTITKNGREVRVNLKDKKYIDHPDWDDKAPIISGGEFYLSKKVYGYLTGYQIDWNNSLQEVVVEGEFIEAVEEESETDADFEAEQKKDEIEDKRDILGDDATMFELSSVHYRLQLDYEDRVIGGEDKDINGDLNFYGRTGNWAYYFNNDFTYDINNEKTEYELDQIKFKYNENNKLIIVGDYDINLEETIGNTEMQGIYFSMPARIAYKLIPYTNISAEVEKGDEISLFLNNRLIKTVSIKSNGKYTFKNVELRARYLNKLEIVILDQDGVESREVEYLAGSSDILASNVKEIELFGGRFRDDDYSGDGWEGYFGGVRSNYSLTKNLSLHAETAVYNKSESEFNQFEDEVLASIIGISFRLADNTVINLDWLIGGQFDNLESGAQASFLYSLLRGYVQGIYAYIPPETAEYMEKDEGENKALSFKWDLSSKISIRPTIGQENTLEDRIDETDYYSFQIIYDPDWRNYHALSLYYEENKEGYLIIPNNEIPNRFRVLIRDNIKKGIGIENNIYANSFRISNKLAYYDNEADFIDIFDNNFRLKDNYQEYEAEIGLYKRFTDYLLISLNYDGEQERDDDGIRYYDREYNGQLRLSFADRASLSLQTKRGIEEEDEDNNEEIEDEEEIIEEETNLRLDYYFNREFSLTAELTDYQSEFLPNYQSLELAGSYYFPTNPGYIRLLGEYIVPDEGDPGISFSAAYDLIRDDESEIKIEVGRDYSNFINNGYDSYATISYSHAISFINGKQRKSRFTDFEPRPIVAGYAYLDENYNGQMDEGEKRLSNIPMRLGNMLSISDEKGFFIFKPYFNDIYFLNFDYRNLIADYTPVTDEILVRVKDNQNIMQNFGLTINGTISGNIFIDKNANGIKDDDEEYLMWAGVELDGLNRKDYADSRGEFYFQNVPLGYHKLNLLKESLPRGTKPLNKYEHDVYITEDRLDHHDIDIPIIYGD